jgi:hypothetical protein
LGNAVNVEIVYQIAKALINEDLVSKIVKMKIVKPENTILKLFANGTN